MDADDPTADLVHERPQRPATARMRAPRSAKRLPGGPPDQPRARRAPDGPAESLARAVPTRSRGRPDRERAARARLQPRALARRCAASRGGAEAPRWLSRGRRPAGGNGEYIALLYFFGARDEDNRECRALRARDGRRSPHRATRTRADPRDRGGEPDDAVR